MYNRKKHAIDLKTQSAGEASSNHSTGKDEASIQRRKKIQRFFQYVAPPACLSAVTVGIFIPSYRLNPVRLIVW